MKILPWVLSMGMAAGAFAGSPEFSDRLNWECEVEEKLNISLNPVELIYDDYDEEKYPSYNKSPGLLAYEPCGKIMVYEDEWKKRGENFSQKTTYIHELGHHAVCQYLDKLGKEIFEERWYGDIGSVIQNEGVAVYFARQFISPRPKAEWPETTDGLEERLKKEQDWAYKIGAQLVTP
ncbi:hypothetical protein GOV10_03065, partial [Candidatus Woesearchaeota archaeon]|nr:hypothetical protein [Candidatus Woesearchaeota archaeon]